MKQPLSYIHPNAKIAKNVVIEPFTSIDGDVEIGEGTWIGSNVSIMDGAPSMMETLDPIHVPSPISTSPSIDVNGSITTFLAILAFGCI